MAVCSALLLMLFQAPQDAKKADAPMTREQRAALVDRIMGEPSRPTLQRPARVELPPEPPAPIQFGPPQKQIRFEMIDPRADEDGEAGPPVPRAERFGAIANLPVVAADNFDRWVFGEGYKDEEARRIHLGSLLTDKIHAVQRDHRINYDQLRKLRLAASGDIKRFLARVEKRRGEFEAVRHDQEAAREFLGRLHPLAVEYKAGPFDADSLFAKTLRRMTEDKAEKKPVEPAPTGVDEVTPPRR